jgi:hypothetical protein
MSEVLMVDLLNPSEANVGSRIIQTIGAFSRTLAGRGEINYGMALLISPDLILNLFDPEDMGWILQLTIGLLEVRQVGSYAGCDLFQTGTSLRRTNGLVFWRADQLGTEEAIQRFYRGNAYGGTIQVSMGPPREDDEPARIVIPRPRLLDMSEVERVMFIPDPGS